MDDRCVVLQWYLIDHRQGPEITNSGTSHQLWPMTMVHRNNALLSYLNILKEWKKLLYLPMPSSGNSMLLKWHNLMMWLTLSYRCNIEIDGMRSSKKTCSICKNSLLSKWLVTTWDDTWAAAMACTVHAPHCHVTMVVRCGSFVMVMVKAVYIYIYICLP